jgi:hypothetical protein
MRIYSDANDPGVLIHASDETYTFKNIRLHPRPPSIVFEKIDIPEDAYIYHIKDGKIVKSEHKDVKPRAPRRISPIALYLLIGAPAIAIVAYIMYRFLARNPVRARSEKRDE